MHETPPSGSMPVVGRPLDAPLRVVESSSAVPVRSARKRLAALAVFVCSAATLGVAAWLKPDARGLGTHQQLGSGPCGMLVSTGFPCPTCGMTTAYAYLMNGAPLRAFLVQPAGFVLALFTVFATLYAAVVVVSGISPGARWLQKLSPYWLYFVLLALLLGGWAYKIIVGVLDGTLPMTAVRL
jgi:hypothetical protein